jgi:hexokinase
MSSGGYLGGLCAFILCRAAEEGVFGPRAGRVAADLRTEDVNEFLTTGGGPLAEYLPEREDAENARHILRDIILRAARLVAVQMAAIAQRTVRSNDRVCMSIEGSVYEKMAGLREELHGILPAYLREQGIQAELVTVERAVMKGCAIAGLSGSY